MMKLFRIHENIEMILKKKLAFVKKIIFGLKRTANTTTKIG